VFVSFQFTFAQLFARFNTFSFYPEDLASRCKIDTMLDWRQSSLYKHIAAYSYPGLGFGGDGSRVEAAGHDLKLQLEDLVRVFLKDGKGKFMGGFDHPTLADLAVGPALVLCTVVPGNEFPKEVGRPSRISCSYFLCLNLLCCCEFPVFLPPVLEFCFAACYLLVKLSFL